MSNPEKPVLPKQTLIEKNHGVYNKWWKSGHKFEDVSPVLWPVGMTSPEGDAILGQDGFIFLIGGSNDLLVQYKKTVADVSSTSSRWSDLFKRRRLDLQRQNIRYVQVIIPEKLSVLPEAFPQDLPVPSTLLRELERSVKDDPDLEENFVSCFDVFQGHARRRQLYRRVDTHASPLGCYAIVQLLLAKLGVEALPQLAFEIQRADFADLGGRMGGILDTYFECDPGWATECKKVKEFEPVSGHQGKRQGWICQDAHCQLKVLVFGNSFFEFAERGQGALSWWMARTFKQFDFIWSPRLDMDLVEEIGPDIVICQSIERFLNEVPAR